MVTCPHCGATYAPRQSLTPMQRRALVALCAYRDRHGVVPSYLELCDALGIASKSGVHRLITGLEARGWVTRGAGRGKGRTLVILARPEPAAAA